MRHNWWLIGNNQTKWHTYRAVSVHVNMLMFNMLNMLLLYSCMLNINKQTDSTVRCTQMMCSNYRLLQCNMWSYRWRQWWPFGKQWGKWARIYQQVWHVVMLSRATVQQSAKTFKFRIGYAKTLLDLTSTPTKIKSSLNVMIRVTHADFDLLNPV